jgi:hypothetical protein
VLCRVSHSGRSRSLSPSKGRNTVGPPRMGGGSSSKVGDIALSRAYARQVESAVAEGEGELVGQGAVFAGMGQKPHSTALLSALCTAWPTCSHLLPCGKCATRFWRLPWKFSQRSWSPRGSARSSSMREQARKAQLSVWAVWNAGVPMGVPVNNKIIYLFIYVSIYLSIYLFIYKHIIGRHYAFSSTQQVHSQQQSTNPHGQDRHREAKHHKQTPHKTTPCIHP